MKKNTMLGVNNETNYCCILTCLLPFNSLVPSELEKSDFTHSSTDWCGQDEIKRTLAIIKMKQTGKKIILNKPIVFYGSDSDMGHVYPWEFEINEIHELVEVEV